MERHRLVRGVEQNEMCHRSGENTHRLDAKPRARHAAATPKGGDRLGAPRNHDEVAIELDWRSEGEEGEAVDHERVASLLHALACAQQPAWDQLRQGRGEANQAQPAAEFLFAEQVRAREEGGGVEADDPGETQSGRVGAAEYRADGFQMKEQEEGEDEAEGARHGSLVVKPEVPAGEHDGRAGPAEDAEYVPAPHGRRQ